MRPSTHLPAILLASLALAGCGASTENQSSAPSAPKAGGPLTVTATDGRVGDATAATSTEALRELKVRRARTSPDVLKQGVGAGAACADVETLPAVDNLEIVAASTLCLVNGERADAGLPPLAANGELARSSLAHSLDMVVKGYFAHRSADGRDVIDRVKATGYIPGDVDWTVGENLAWGTGTLASPLAIVRSWMASQGHRENILRPAFKEAGLGIVIGNPSAPDGHGATYTMNYGAVNRDAAGQLVSGSAAGATTRTTSAAKRAAARRAAAKRLRSCRAKARRSRASSRKVREARVARCVRAARRR